MRVDLRCHGSYINSVSQRRASECRRRARECQWRANGLLWSACTVASGHIKDLAIPAYAHKITADINTVRSELVSDFIQ